MGDLSISLEWVLQEDVLKPDAFSKNHKIEINNNFFNAGSAPEYGGKENELNPEQSLAAAISSCHMMTFLALAAKMRWPVKSYKDNAHAFLGKNSKGKMCVNKIELNPIKKALLWTEEFYQESNKYENFSFLGKNELIFKSKKLTTEDR